MSRTQPALSDGVHVWSDRVGEQDHDEAFGLLDADERARAARFRFAGHRARFVARRAFLRRVLAGYLAVTPRTIRYRTTGTGRPELDPPSSLNFSTSHSEGLAVVAVAGQHLVGVDIERVRPIWDGIDIARALFARREYEHLRATPDEERSVAFLRLWTRKEACVKALGLGLSVPLDTVDVLDDVAEIRIAGGSADGASFVLTSLDDHPSYVGAVAVAGTALSVERIPIAATAP